MGDISATHSAAPVNHPLHDQIGMSLRFRILPIVAVALHAHVAVAGNTWVSDLRGYDQRAATIGHRLATAALPYCDRTIPTLGLSLDAIERYDHDDRGLVRSELGLGDAVQISAVVPDGPASAAGAQPSDSLIAVDSEPVADFAGGPPALARLEQVLTVLNDTDTRTGTVLTLRREGTEFVAHIIPQVVCDVEWVVSTRTSQNTFSDGRHVDLPVGLFRFVKSDDELAFVAAHELAHSIFKQKRRGAKGLKARRELEHDADTVAVALLWHAGYDPMASAEFWSRFAKADTFGFLRSPSHLSTSDRITRLLPLAARLNDHASERALASRLIDEVLTRGEGLIQARR